ncbi:11S globulin seed storage protein Jug r 4 [Sesamum alatum]|uniref:11S globulin seed storage protein Jug r 4 n=1 Tax=Sesamum alatum TaxID=300844 RepID=A0AAE2CDR3_9LAMI|nr:11S globulin seed storage protein Jug r 4 [Sesamum alatum]
MEPPELENPSKNTQEERSDEDVSDHDSEDEECDVAEMKKTRSKSLVEFRFRVEEAILGNYLVVRKNDDDSKNAENFMDIRLWGVPLLPSQGHEGTDTVLMKFLKAKRYKVHEAFTLLRKTLKWRGEFRPDDIVGGDSRPEINGLWFTSGRDKIGRPLCYIILGKEWQKKMLSTEEYLRWRVLCLEKGIQNLSFRPGGVDSLVQIIDLKNSPGTASKEVKLICKRITAMHQDNYPALVYKNLIINVPSWFMALNTLNLRLITQKSRNKFVFVKSSRVTETLLKYATAENLLVEYGGLKRENDTEFSTDDKVLEVNIRAGTTELIQIPVNEVGVTVMWDVTVVGYEVGYKEEFVPDDDCSYIVLIQEKKMLESIRNSFHIREPGKIVITIVNGAYAKKKAFYRPLFLLYKYHHFPVAASHHQPRRVYLLLFLLSTLYYTMAKLFFSVLCLLLLFGFGFAVRGGTWQQGECQIRSINAQEPSYSLQAEGGVTEFWDFKNDEFQCAGASLRRHRLQPRALMLPLYHNAPVLVYVVQGRGIHGLMISGCPETFESSQQRGEQSEEGRRQRFRDRHQKIEEFRQGDIVAIPAGAAHWAYNDGDQELVVVVLHDNANNANQLDQNPRTFLLAGNPERGQEQQQGLRRGQRELGNVFRGFDVHMLAEVFGVDEETARRLQGEDDRRGHMVIVAQGLHAIRPPISRQEYGREEEGYYGGRNGLEETICSAKTRENLDKPSRADVYNPRAGRLSTVNSLTLPILRFLQLSAARGVLYRNGIMAPHWSINAHSIIYVTRGEARMQIVNHRGEAVFDGGVREGQVVVVPQNFAAVKQAGEEGCEWVEFNTNDNAMISTLSGRTSAIRGLPADVIATAYQISREEAERLKFSRRETIIFSGRGAARA